MQAQAEIGGGQRPGIVVGLEPGRAQAHATTRERGDRGFVVRAAGAAAGQEYEHAGKSRAIDEPRLAAAHRVQQQIEILVARPRRGAHDQRRLRAADAECVEEPPAARVPGFGRQRRE